jgi:hypothetical protein
LEAAVLDAGTGAHLPEVEAALRPQTGRGEE